MSSKNFPAVWTQFSATVDGQTTRYSIRPLDSAFTEDAMSLLKEVFVDEEPPCKHIGVRRHPAALAELERLWRTALAEGVSLACVAEDRLVGVNVLSVASVDDKDQVFQTSDPVWATLFGAVELVAKSVDIFSAYGVARYLTAYGLVVHRAHRGRGVGAELLRARVPLCRHLGLALTATVFTAAASQKVAARAGFRLLAEVTYDEMARAHGFVFPGINASTTSSKLMALTVDD